MYIYHFIYVLVHFVCLPACLPACLPSCPSVSLSLCSHVTQTSAGHGCQYVIAVSCTRVTLHCVDSVFFHRGFSPFFALFCLAVVSPFYSYSTLFWLVSSPQAGLPNYEVTRDARWGVVQQQPSEILKPTVMWGSPIFGNNQVVDFNCLL